MSGGGGSSHGADFVGALALTVAIAPGGSCTNPTYLSKNKIISGSQADVKYWKLILLCFGWVCYRFLDGG